VTRSTHLSTADGTVLAATVRSHPDPRAAVVVAHGFSGHQHQPEVVGLADALVGAGFSVVTYDGRGHGASTGLCTLGDCERLDVAAAADLAGEEGPLVVVVGASMGGIAVLRYACVAPGPAAVVTVSTPAVWRVPRSARGILSLLITQTPPGRRLAAARLGVRLARGRVREAPPVELASGLRLPLAVVHGRADRFVSPKQAELLYRAAAGPKRIELVPGMGHAFDPLAVPAVLAGVRWGVERAEQLRAVVQA
jgi:alpha-beta hydrolase superfamily lysophospholipase